MCSQRKLLLPLTTSFRQTVCAGSWVQGAVQAVDTDQVTPAAGTVHLLRISINRLDGHTVLDLVCAQDVHRLEGVYLCSEGCCAAYRCTGLRMRQLTTTSKLLSLLRCYVYWTKLFKVWCYRMSTHSVFDIAPESLTRIQQVYLKGLKLSSTSYHPN